MSFDVQLSLPVVRNCMKLIAAGAASDAFESLGISIEDFELACSNTPYVAQDRPRVVAVLDALTHGVVDVVGLPRIEVPAEFRAGILVTFVSPGNLAVACRWSEKGTTANDIVNGGSLEPVLARELFALCCQLAEEAPAAAAAWSKRTKRAVRNAMPEEKQDAEG